MYQRLEVSQRVDANDCDVGSQCSICNRAERRGTVDGPQFRQLIGTALKLSESLFG
jgi:hypothetical protein